LLARQCSDPERLLSCDPHPGCLRQRSQSPGDARELPWVVELPRGDLRLKHGVQDNEIDPQSVDQPGALADQHVAVIAEQSNLDCILVEKRAREPLDALAQNSSGDRSRVDLI